MRNNTAPAPVADWNWPTLTASLDHHGYAVTPTILSTADCTELAALYEHPDPWRSRIAPDRYRMGPGEYRQFANPLPDTLTTLRKECYARLAPIANTWNEQLRMSTRYPAHLKQLTETCHLTGHPNPASLIQRHRTDEFHSLHQEEPTPHAFPLQLTILLSKPNKDFSGGEILLMETLPRAQSRGHAITLKQGQGVLWPGRYRPGTGNRGHYPISICNGINTVHTGTRYALELIFHDTD